MGEGRALKELRTFCEIRDEKSSDGIVAEARAERGKKLINIDLFTISWTDLKRATSISIRAKKKNKDENRTQG